MSDNKKKGDHEDESQVHYMPIFMSIGVGTGVAIGSATGNIAIGMSIGSGLGLAIGAAIDALNRKSKKNTASSEEMREGSDIKDE